MAPKGVSPQQLAKKAKLQHVSDEEPGIRRQRCGRGFSYVYDDTGRAVRDKRHLDRIAALAIPPAWSEVWICREPRGHLQATGRDDRKRKQFIYHEQWQQASTLAKFDRLAELGDTLSRIRQRVLEQLRKRKPSRNKTLALVVRLLDRTGMRVGREEYVAENGSYGLTTLHRRHLRISGAAAEFRFPGKSGQRQSVVVKDRSAVTALETVADAGGSSLFTYPDDDGLHSVDAQDVNDYLREISSVDITAKDFRTWLASAQAAAELYDQSDEPEKRRRKKVVVETVKAVARSLGNTPSVCQKSYLDPRLIEAYEAGEFPNLFSDFQFRKRKWLRREDQILQHALAKM